MTMYLIWKRQQVLFKDSLQPSVLNKQTEEVVDASILDLKWISIWEIHKHCSLNPLSFVISEVVKDDNLCGQPV